MATITVDVELDEFDLDDILDEVERRYSSGYTKEDDKKSIEEFIDAFSDVKNENLTIIDQMKIDFLIANLERITIVQLENLVI